MKKITKDMTNRERCIYDWEILASNPGMTKSELQEKHKKDGNEDQIILGQCWACEEERVKGRNCMCTYCPVTWGEPKDSMCEYSRPCLVTGSVYQKYTNNGRISGSEVLATIKNTWKEKEKIIAMEDMKPFEIGVIINHSLYAGIIVIRTASTFHFEVINMNVLIPKNSWTNNRESIEVKLFSEKETQEYLTKIENIFK